jgi:hypothetical protein
MTVKITIGGRYFSVARSELLATCYRILQQPGFFSERVGRSAKSPANVMSDNLSANN